LRIGLLAATLDLARPALGLSAVRYHGQPLALSLLAMESPAPAQLDGASLLERYVQWDNLVAAYRESPSWPVRVDGRWLVDGSLAANHPIIEAQMLGADDVYAITTATAPRNRPPRGAVAAAMNSVSLVTARAGQRQSAEAEQNALATGSRVHLVPTSMPAAPGPFDFRRSAELAGSSYHRTAAWLADEVLR